MLISTVNINITVISRGVSAYSSFSPDLLSTIDWSTYYSFIESSTTEEFKVPRNWEQ